MLSFVDPAADPAEDVRATRAYCREVVTLPNGALSERPRAKRLEQTRSLFSPHSYEWCAHRNAPFERALNDLAARGGFDVVQFEFPYMASYASARACAGAALVLDEHNIEFDIGRQTTSNGGGVSRRLYHSINWRKLLGDERWAWRHVDGCTVTSARDEALLLAHAPGTRTAIVPNAVDLDDFRPRDVPRTTRGTMLFFGAVDYYPNTDGLLFFFEEILPRVRIRLPTARLSIVGRRPPPVIAAHHGRGVDVVGAVDDVRPHIHDAAVVVVPLRLGGGTRLKVLEAMAMGKAVVSTSLGAQGLDVVHDREICIADDPDAFAAKVVELLADPERAHRLGLAARRRVEAQYGWAACAGRLRDFHREVLEARGSARAHG